MIQLAIKDFDSKLEQIELSSTKIFKNDNNQGIIFKWNCPSIGYGEYTLIYNKETNEWIAESEAMDSNKDKKLLSALLNKFKENINIIS